MQLNGITSARRARAKQFTQIAHCDYTNLSHDQLIQEAADLHRVLAESHRFGRVAELGIRRHCVEMLIGIDREHARRATGSTVQVAA